MASLPPLAADLALRVAANVLHSGSVLIDIRKL